MDWIFVLVAYLLGSVPTGILVAKAHGADLRGTGSGNIGATNALRVLGKKAGAMTLIGDMLKGVLAVLIAYHFAGRDMSMYAAAAAVIGHDFPVFLGFRGGKGVATSFGAVLAVEPPVGLVCLAVWLASVLIWRYSSLGALMSFIALIPAALAITGDDRFTALSVFLSMLIFIKHRSNIGRLIKGTEPKVGRKTAEVQ